MLPAEFSGTVYIYFEASEKGKALLESDQAQQRSKWLHSSSGGIKFQGEKLGSLVRLPASVQTPVFQSGETGARIGHPGGHLERTTMTHPNRKTAAGKYPPRTAHGGARRLCKPEVCKRPPRRPSQVQRRRSRCLWGVAEAPLQARDQTGRGGRLPEGRAHLGQGAAVLRVLPAQHLLELVHAARRARGRLERPTLVRRAALPGAGPAPPACTAQLLLEECGRAPGWQEVTRSQSWVSPPSSGPASRWP